MNFAARDHRIDLFHLDAMKSAFSGRLGIKALFTIILSIIVSGCSGLKPETGITPESTSTTTPVTKEKQLVSDSKKTQPSGLTEDILYNLLVAEFAGHRGSLELATQNYMNLARKIKDPALAERATRIMIYARDDKGALEAAKLWVEYAPENIEARQIVAAMHIRNNQPDEAFQQLDEILNNHPQDTGKAMQLLATFLSREEDKQTALKVMERLMASRQNDNKAMFAYGLLTLRGGNTDKAKTIIKKVIALEPDEQNYQMVYLSILEKEGNKQAAMNYLEKLLESNPDNLNLRIAHARYLADLGRYDESLAAFEAITKSHPDSTDAHYALGLLNLQTDHTNEAEKQFKYLISKRRLVNESSYYLGQIAEYNKNHEEAITWYQAIDTSNTNFFDAQIKIALAMARLNRIDEARIQLAKTTPQNRQQELQLVKIEAEILIEEDKLDEAMAVYTKALDEKTDPDLLYSRAMLAEKMGRIDQLERDLLTIIENDPDNADVLNALGYTLADRTDRYEEAHGYIKRALELSPDNFYILDSMGWVLYRLGRFDESIKFLKRAKALNDDPEIAAHLGEVLWFNGNKESARDILNNALKSTPEDEKLLEVFKRLRP